jgi:hypothetical protein
MRELSRQALNHLDRFQNDQALNDFRARRRDFDDRIAELMQGVARNDAPSQLVAQLKAVDRAYGAMATAENLGAHGTAEMEPRYEAAFARAAARVGAQGQNTRDTLAKALANNSSLRAVFGASVATFDNAATAVESEEALGMQGSAARAVRLLGLIGGPVNQSVQADELALADQRRVPQSKQQQALQAVNREVLPALRRYVDNAALNNMLDRDSNDWLAEKFEYWAENVRLSGDGVQAYHAIGELLRKKGNQFEQGLVKFTKDIAIDNKYNIGSKDVNALNQAINENFFEEQLRKILGDLRVHFKNMYDDIGILDPFKEWLKESANLN